MPTLHFRVSLALIPLHTHTHIVPCLPTLLEEQLKLLASVQPGKGKWEQQTWLDTVREGSGVVGTGGSSACPGDVPGHRQDQASQGSGTMLLTQLPQQGGLSPALHGTR